MEDGKVIIKKKIVKKDDINMLVTGMLHKDGKILCAGFIYAGRDWAEGIVPDAKIEKSEGFTKEEIDQLEKYLLEEKTTILEQAKGVNPLRNMFGI